MTPEAWAQNVVTLHTMIRDVFGKRGRKPQISSEAAGLLRAASERAAAAAVPSTYGPCNGPRAIGAFSSEFMNNITALGGKGALSAFSFHGYQHPDSTVAAVADMVGRGGIDASKDYFEAVNTNHKSANTQSQLWITETAWSASAPAGAPEGGARAAIDGMCRAADIAWNLDALGAAAEAGVDVFCRETLAGMQPLSRSTQWCLAGLRLMRAAAARFRRLAGGDRPVAAGRAQSALHTTPRACAWRSWSHVLRSERGAVACRTFGSRHSGRS